MAEIEERDDQLGLDTGPIRFSESPFRFAREYYEECEEYIEKQSFEVVENRQMFYGYDEELTRRKEDSSMERAGHFIPELQPAVDTLQNTAIDQLDEDPLPMRLLRAEDSQTPIDQFMAVEKQLNREMRDAGLFSAKLRQITDAAAVMPVAAVKVSWDELVGYHYIKRVNPIRAMVQRFLGTVAGIAPDFQVEESIEEYGVIDQFPAAEFLDHGELLYDPTAHTIHRSRGVIHKQWLTRSEIEEQAQARQWQRSAVSDWLNSGPYQGEDDEKSSADKAAEDTDEARESASYHAGKFLLQEMWIPSRKRDGKLCVYQYCLANHQFPLYDGHGRRHRYGSARVKFPFALFTWKKKFNQIEGWPLVGQAKGLQRLYSDAFNCFADGVSYGIFPVLVALLGTEFEEDPIWRPGGIMHLSADGKIQELRTQLGDAKILLTFGELIAGKIRQLVNAPDIAQGLEEIAEEEKATKTKLRAAGAARRTRGQFKQIGEFLINIAEMFVYLHQAAGDTQWFLDGMTIDCPALTNVHPPEVERAMWMQLMALAHNHRVYARPDGDLKLREMFAKVLELHRVRDIDRYLPTREAIEVAVPAGEAIEEAGEAKRRAEKQQSLFESTPGAMMATNRSVAQEERQEAA